MNYLTVRGTGTVEIDVLEGAKTRRDELLAEAATINSVVDQIDADAAGETLKRCKDMVREVEASRVEVKAPVLELSRRIDALAKELTSSVDTEATRISRVLGAWQAEERRKAEEARRRAAEEEARIRREAERRQREAERNAADAQQAAEHAAAIQQVAVERIVQARQEAEAQVALSRPAGATVRETWCFEVTDIQALYQAAPYLVTLSPNAAAIRAAIKQPQNQQLPGLRVWKEARSIV
jgi:gas vesicle protein